MLNDDQLNTDERIKRLEVMMQDVLKFIQANKNQQITLPLDLVSIQILKKALGL